MSHQVWHLVQEVVGTTWMKCLMMRWKVKMEEEDLKGGDLSMQLLHLS